MKVANHSFLLIQFRTYLCTALLRCTLYSYVRIPVSPPVLRRQIYRSRRATPPALPLYSLLFRKNFLQFVPYRLPQRRLRTCIPTAAAADVLEPAALSLRSEHRPCRRRGGFFPGPGIRVPFSVRLIAQGYCVYPLSPLRSREREKFLPVEKPGTAPFPSAAPYSTIPYILLLIRNIVCVAPVNSRSGLNYTSEDHLGSPVHRPCPSQKKDSRYDSFRILHYCFRICRSGIPHDDRFVFRKNSSVLKHLIPVVAFPAFVIKTRAFQFAIQIFP